MSSGFSSNPSNRNCRDGYALRRAGAADDENDGQSLCEITADPVNWLSNAGGRTEI